MREHDAPPRLGRDPNEGALATWDPGEKLLREEFDSKWPVEAKSDAVGIETSNGRWQKSKSVKQH